MEESMLTTLDNPFNPFTQFDAWYSFDFRKGYHTPEYLARVVETVDGLSPTEENEKIENAIASIVALNLTGNYCRVTRKTFDDIVTKQIKV